MPDRLYAVYIATNASRTLYTGITNDLQRRMFEHREGKVPGFTQQYRIRRLVYFEVTADVRVPSRGRSRSRDGSGTKKSPSLNP